MKDLWLKIKIWTTITVSSLCLVYLLIFIIENANKPVLIWVWFGHPEVETTALKVIIYMFLAGIVGTVLAKVAYKTVKQIRSMRSPSSGPSAQMEKDIAEIKAKASMLQTKPDVKSNSSAST